MANQYSRSEIDRHNRYLKRYQQMKNPGEKYVQTYNDISKMYGGNFNDQGLLDPHSFSGKQERAFRRANPFSDYSKERELRYLDDYKQMKENNTGYSDAQKKEAERLADKWNYEINPQADTEPVNFDDYRTESATMEDLAKKYGFDFSRDYAKRIAEAEAQAKRDQVESSRNRIDQNIQNQTENLDANYFQQYMNLAQGQVANGINSGIAADQNMRLQMAMNADMSDVYRDANANRFELDKQAGRIEQERLAREDSLFNERLQQAFENIMTMDSANRQENLSMLQAALQQRGMNIDLDQWQKQFDRNNAEWESEQKYSRWYNEWMEKRRRAEWESSEKWKRYFAEKQFNNLSASEKAQLSQNASQFGQDMAFKMWQFEQGMISEKEMNQAMIDQANGNFNTSGGGGDYGNRWKSKQASKSPTYNSFLGHLNAAVSVGKIPQEWVPGMIELVGRESSWNPNADNPSSTAYGYGQFLDSTRKSYERKTGLDYSNPVNQLIMMAQYVKDRYGTPAKALQFWDKNHWY